MILKNQNGIKGDYYSKKLSADRLKRCYDIAPPRIRQYLQAEIDFVRSKIKSGSRVLDLGCGYGRIFKDLAKKSASIIGIDNSFDSLSQAKQLYSQKLLFYLVRMNAVKLAFGAGSFDAIICIQNGISAFQVDQTELIKECIRATKPGGIILLSSYAEKFWPFRLHWFELQAREGLLGRIDYEKTGEGVIVCEDGFRASTVSSEQFLSIAANFNVQARIHEVDQSSLFCEISIPL